MSGPDLRGVRRAGIRRPHGSGPPPPFPGAGRAGSPATDCRGCGNFQPDRHGGRGAWRPPLQSRRRPLPPQSRSGAARTAHGGRFRAMPARGAARRASAPHSRAEAVWRLRAHRVRAAGLAQGGGWLRQAGLYGRL